MFSVIVPVYCVENYLAACLDSVLPALEPEDELLLAIGRSDDGSAAIAEAYANRHKIVRQIWQTGTGLSNARNCAALEARGDYVIYIDSDDFVDTQAFQGLLNRIRREEWTDDVVVTDFFRLDRRTGVQTPFFQIGSLPDQQGMSFLPRMLRRHQCFWNVWRFLYRRQFLLANQIVFAENTLSEDIDYTTQTLICAETIRFVHHPYYVYTVGRGDSLMDLPTWKRLQDTVHVLSDSIHRLENSGFSQKRCVVSQLQFEFLLNLAQICELPKGQRRAAKELFRSNLQCLSPPGDAPVGILLALVRVLGIGLSARGLFCLKHMRRLWRKRRKKR